MRFLVTTAPGLQSLLINELKELGVAATQEGGGALAFEGEWEQAANVMYNSRLASRVLLSLREFSAKNPAMLYDQVRRVDWPGIFKTEETFSVQSHGLTPPDMVLSFVSLKIKDGIVDEFRKRGLERPNVERVKPDARIEAYFYDGRCELSLDLCGEPLHKRGYREEQGEAPLRENRAAALLRLAGYDGSQPLIDPFCGSGTIVIEGAMIQARMAPGLLRERAGYAGAKLLPDLANALKKAADHARARRAEAPRGPVILGRDTNTRTLEKAQSNVRRAGLFKHVHLEQGDALKLATEQAMIVCNPPYGERLGAGEAQELLAAFTRQCKHHCKGSVLALVLARGPLEKAVGLRPSAKITFENGPIPSRLLKFELF